MTTPRPVVALTTAEAPWGAETSLALLAAGTSAHGRDFTTVCLSPTVANFLRSSDVTTVLVPHSARRIKNVLNFHRWVISSAPEASVVLFSLQLAPLAPLLRLSPAFRGQVTLDLHDAPEATLDRLLVRACLPFLDRVVSVSQFALDWLHVPRTVQQTVVHRPVLVPSRRVPDALAEGPRVRVGIVGRLDPVKRIELAIQAFQYTPENVTLLVIGSPSEGNPTYAAELRQYAARVAPGRVEFTGYRGSDSLYDDLNLVIVANHLEPSGRSVAEALAAGLPVAVPDRGGSLEYVQDGTTGLVYRAGDPGSLGMQIARLASSPALAARLGENGRMWANAHWSQSAFATQYLSCLDGSAE